MTRDIWGDQRITAIGLLFEVHAGLAARFSAQIDEHGLSLVEFEVLMRLARSPERSLRMSDLSAQTSLSTSGVTRVVDRMVRDGLISRRACPGDRRISYAVLTEDGLRRVDETLPGHLELVEHWFTGQVTEAQLSCLMASLRSVRDAVYPCAVAGAAQDRGGGPVGGGPAGPAADTGRKTGRSSRRHDDIIPERDEKDERYR